MKNILKIIGLSLTLAGCINNSASQFENATIKKIGNETVTIGYDFDNDRFEDTRYVYRIIDQRGNTIDLELVGIGEDKDKNHSFTPDEFVYVNKNFSKLSKIERVP